MNPSKLLYQCWVFVKKMNQQVSITTDTLLTSLAQLPACRSFHGTLYYRIAYDDKFNKLKPLHAPFDAAFLKNTADKTVAFHLARLKALLKYEMPYESALQPLLTLLTQPPARAILIDLCVCLQLCPRLRSQTFAALITRIYELIEGELDGTVVMDRVFLLTMLRVTSRSLYRVPLQLQCKLHNLLEGSLELLEDKQIRLISNMMIPKSTRFWTQLLRREDNPFYQKVVAKKFLQDGLGVTLEDELLPGQTPKNCQELEEAIACVQSAMHREPYIEIFPENLFAAMYAELPDVWRLYVSYLFYHTKKEFFRLPQEAVEQLVRRLEASIRTNFDAALQKTDLVKLHVILFDISRDQASTAALKPQLERIHQLIKSKITVDYLKSNYCEGYQFGELQCLGHVLMHHLLLIASGRSEEALELKLVEKMVRSRREKYKSKLFETIEEMLSYITHKRVHLLKTVSAIAKTPLTQQEIEHIKVVFPLAEVNTEGQLCKNVIINLSIELPIAFVSPSSQVVWALEYEPLLSELRYDSSSSSVEPLSRAWLRTLLESAGCSYAVAKAGEAERRG